MSKVTSKYQITIHREVRTALNIMTGLNVVFKEEKGKFYLAKSTNYDPIEKWRGSFKGTKTTDAIVAELRGYGIEDID